MSHKLRCFVLSLLIKITGLLYTFILFGDHQYLPVSMGSTYFNGVHCFCAGLGSCHCKWLKVAVGLVSSILIVMLALVGVVGAVGCRKWCRNGRRFRSGGVQARYMKEVGYDYGKDSKSFLWVFK